MNFKTMGKIILYIAASLDGYIARKDDDISWLFPYNDVDYGYNEFFATIGAVIKGRRTYEIEVESGWENAHPVPTFVLSAREPKSKPQRADVVFTHEDISEVLRKARQLTDKNIWIEGGANVAQQFLRQGLIEEIVLSIIPIILGDGIRLFENIDRQIELSLIEIKRFDKGLVQLIYNTAR